METKHPKTEKYSSDQTAVWSLDQELSGQPKSYTCSFCQKGFSNAQALGGHMNIHRRDRAKLRESSEENNMLSLDDHNSQVDSEIIVLESSEDKSSSSNAKRSSPSKISREEYIYDGVSSSSASPARNKDAVKTLSVENYEDSSLLPMNKNIELDLELRLGPEPNQDNQTRTI
ncbi:hypothetical protein CCACVL1_21179 [Corchorus capsularis]|uniref:C2H2-type domain-containing protein n=1 Tax=Corchorus capsularis TaxID=210143 RepID=A0A1R3H828_COCAP|nr:hypothetical protein CCACVL1_21179 [Corchorus capsularis]